jgi:PAS domain S-box-containing protein
VSTDRQVVRGLAEQTAPLRAIRSSVVARYGIALGVALLAILLRLALDPIWGVRLPYITLFPAIMVTAWLGGLWPGVITTALCGVAAEYFWLEPSRFFSVTEKSDLLGLLVFMVVGVVISALNEAWRRGTVGLAESEQRLSVTLSSIGDGVVTTDQQGRVVRVNPVAEALTGWTESDAVGRRLEDIFVIINEETRRPTENPMGTVLRDNVIVGLANHTVLISKDGREIPIDDSAAPIRNEDGEIAGVIMVFRDVSDRRRGEREREASLERERVARVETERLAEAERAARAAAEQVAVALRESEERLRITIASIGDAVLATDERGRITQLNPVGEALTGWRQAEALGRPLEEVLVIVNETSRQPAPNPVERVLRDGVVTGLANHTVLISKTGREIPIDDSAAPVRAADGRLLGAVRVFRDITERRQAERERAARGRVSRELAAIVESSDDAILSTDLDGTITAWNRAAEQMYGYAAGEAIGQSIRLIVSEDHWDDEAEVLQRIRQGERVEHVETVRRRKDGAELAVSITVSPVLDDAGAVVGVSKIARDVTARRQIEAEKAALLEAERAARRGTEIAVQQLQAALRAGRMGTWQYTVGTGEVRWSEALEEMHGFTPGSFPGTFEAFRNEIHPEDRDRVLAAIRTAFEGRRDHHVEYRIVRADGASRWVEGVGQVVCDENGRPERMLGVCVDITERAQVLAREQAAREEMERASRLKDEFLAVLSHELRTPLNAVLGYAHLLNSGVLPPERASHALDAIQRNARAQARLVESLLDLSRVMAGKLELNLEELNLATIVTAAVDALGPGAEEKGIAIDALVPPMSIVADGGRLQQVFWNLLSNAIKFSDRGGRVAIRCTEEDAHVRVQVTDDGQGIGADFLPYVFDRFSQADGQSRRSRTGLGLGLALVREMVQAHGGKVAAESPGEGRGSTFTVTLPLSVGSFAPGSKRTSAPQARAPESFPPIEILIVDDDGDVRDLLALLVESRGASARTVSSASEALDAISQRRPDLLLADLRMPDEDGYSLIRKVRAREREQQEERLPAIAVTAYASPSDRDQAIAAGFDSHVAKPVEPAELARAVANVARGFSPKNETV